MERQNFKMSSIKVKDNLITGTYSKGDGFNYSFTGDKNKIPHPDLFKIVEAFDAAMAFFLMTKPKKVKTSGIKIKEKQTDQGIVTMFSISGTMQVYNDKMVGLSIPQYNLEDEQDTVHCTLKPTSEDEEAELIDLDDAIERLETELFLYIKGEKEAQGNLFNKKETE